MEIRTLVSLFLVVALLLCSCSADSAEMNPKYTIFEKDGKMYMEFRAEDTETADTSAHKTENIAIEYPHFDSISEMREQIRSGNISSDHLNSLRLAAENNVLEIWPINELFDVVLPSGLEYESISWLGNAYSFQIRTGGFHGYVMCCNEEYYTREYNEKFAYTLRSNATLISETVAADRNAQVIHYKNNTGEYKAVRYEITTAQGSIYVYERYCVDYYIGGVDMDVSESIPNVVRIFGNEGDRYFFGWFSGFEERPAVDWLSSFSLIPA